MYSISDSIEAIGGIINELLIDADKLADFKKQYAKISLRSRNTNFYLSAIGDFSSGKSTLINTLIKRKLLKVAHAATTAVPTYIYRGKNSRFFVNVQVDSGKKYDLTSETDISKFEERFNVKLPDKMEDKISLLTADKELSLKIRQVDIILPNDQFVNDICIIDTPGINPGADFAEKHEEITKNILNEIADAIIILFPADQAYTQSFEKFLKDNAEYFMKDAIFVVTMMDRVDEEERDDIIKFVKANLRSSFNLKNPQVLSCSAMQYGKDPYWTNKFEEFERSLMEKLSQNRQRIITEKLIKLSNELLCSIQSEILDQKNGSEKRLTILQSHSVPNLAAVLAESEAAVIDELSKIQDEHNTAIENESLNLDDKIMQKIKAGLNACDTRSGVTKYVKESLASDIETACSEVYAESAMYTDNLNQALSKAVSGMIEELKVYYGEIGSVLPESTSLAVSEQKVAISDKLTGLSGMIGDYEGKLDIATTIGGAGLAAVILAGLGPVGWIIGGAAALIGGDRLFVNSTRSKVIESVSVKIPDISGSIVRELRNGMETNCSKARKSLEAKRDELVSQYQPIYEKLEQQFNSEKQELSWKIQNSERTQDKIKEVLQKINTIKGEISL